ncbi:MAG: 3-hydroxyacyl-CoA dehydrogenase NAD-binding domain-containing protein, partial [Gemmatimonadota bacterium]
MPQTAKPDVAVVGAGYIGAVLSAVLADSGASVRAVDIDEDVVRAYNAGRSPVREPGLEELIGETVRAGRLVATTDPSVVADADVVLLTVGTPLKDDGTADMSHIQAAVASIAPHVRDGQLVVVKSTVPPFTTERHVAEPLRERA